MLDPQQEWLLRQLRESELSQAKIAEQMGIAPQSLTTRIKALISQGYISRKFLEERNKKYGRPGRKSRN